MAKKSHAKILAYLLVVFFGFIISSAHAWRKTVESKVSNIYPFPGGFDVSLISKPETNTGCSSFRFNKQESPFNVTETDVSRYLSILLTVDVTEKPIQFEVGDSDCNIYRMNFN